MVINVKEYSESYIDTNLAHHNINLAKKKRITKLPDVDFAIKIAHHLVKKLGLDLQVCHNLSEDIQDNDFIFSGDSWLDPGQYIN